MAACFPTPPSSSPILSMYLLDVPVELGCATFLTCGCCSLIQMFIKSHRSRVFIELNGQPLLFAFSGVSEWGWKFQSSNYLVLLVTGSILRLCRVPIQTHLISIQSGVLKRATLWMKKDAPITQEIPRILGALCQEPEPKTKNISSTPQRFSKNLALKCSSDVFKNNV